MTAFAIKGRIMTWQRVIAFGFLITGAVVGSATGNNELAMVLAGAACGMAVPPSTNQEK